MKKELTYISLFSCAGVGCYGFKQERFECVATNEFIERRLKIQKYNHKCKYDTGYICGDIQLEDTKDKIREEIKRWKLKGTNVNNSLDLLVATPPCQGMSIANRKQNDKEINRNSLVVESISLINEFKPNFFLFENVPAFMNTLCINKDEDVLSIREEIEKQLGKNYIYMDRVLNFKNYGSNSSRTRTLVIGVKKELANEILPIELFPKYQKEPLLKDVIGNLKSLEWDEIDDSDIFHGFRTYDKHMREWIHDMPEGMSAFDNEDETKRPHKVVDGVIIPHQRKLSGKYTRNSWDKVGPCIHTRNDQMASQNTLHPKDDRVFSIRELMLLMTIPQEFKWIDEDYETLNGLSLLDKKSVLKKNDVNIRQCIGEAVPTNVFRQIGENIKKVYDKNILRDVEIRKIIEDNSLYEIDNIKEFIRKNHTIYSLSTMIRICELSNINRKNNNAYYTNKELLHYVYNYLPNIEKETIHIIEPAIGLGCMLPIIMEKYSDKKIDIDVVDIDGDFIEILKIIVEKYSLEKENVKIRYIVGDFLLLDIKKRYDLSITNPPFEKMSLEKYRVYNDELKNKELIDSVNIVSYFLDKMLSISNYVVFVSPKNILSTKDYETTRDVLSKKKIDVIVDFGECGFKGVLIETVCLFIDNVRKSKDTIVRSIAKNLILKQHQSYIMDRSLPYWIIYRNDFFDKVYVNLDFDVFSVYRDRQITNKDLLEFNGKDDLVRVLKSRNISDDGKDILDIVGYDSYIDKNVLKGKEIEKYLDRDDVYLVPNMTYYPRMMKKPRGVVVNGSLAVLELKENQKYRAIDESDLTYFSTKEFRGFYEIARNFQTRSLNIDKNSVFFFGIRKGENK